MPNETAWLIEMVNNDAPMPRYWNPSRFKAGWVWDANEAIRFCRKQDAQDYLDGTALLSGNPVEHEFIVLGAIYGIGLQRYADTLVAEAVERCAKVAEEQTEANVKARQDRADDELAFQFAGLGKVIAAAIRDRGKL